MLRAGVRQPRLLRGAQAGARGLRREDRDRPDRPRLPSHRARTRGGRAGALRRAMSGSAFVDGSAVCWSGYYHGILERAFAGVSEEDLPAVSRRLCESDQVRRSDFVAYQCVHGLGHGLMIYTDYDMPLSLETCDALATSWDQTSCTGGVFMENLQTSYGTRSKWLRDGRSALPVPDRGRAAQALLLPDGDVAHPRRRRRRLGSRPSTGAARQSLTGWRRASSRSAATPRAARSRTRPRSSASARSPGRWTSECIYGAARDITSMDAGARRSAEVLLRGQRPTAAPACFNGIGTILGGFSREAGARRAACRSAVPKQYWDECFAGAGAPRAEASRLPTRRRARGRSAQSPCRHRRGRRHACRLSR